MHAARFGVGDEQFFARAGDADVSEPALFFQPSFVIDRSLAGEQTLFHADQEHHWKLQSLGRMQCHELHAVIPYLALVFTGLKCGVREECGQLVEASVDVFLSGLETAGDVDQLVQIFHPRLGVTTTVLLVEIAQAGVGDGMVDLLGEREVSIAPLSQRERG